ncbi:TIGR04283 family arsenosugar biosynthesis glycosyltransferase [Acaryochloris sp. IP29b_bin.137]|uniref:TIGR04283 family arsenosugar biosynthesis glycosyltransferase n=1 Tax=Acaryochloris sp. IP29b_bin.137 TaxID=2969217 RepID=UPI00260ECD36|nr:TIGR04283 family arsenosugar biosynthesis glycosyltransferase [Acaryochloris sp. IP29b_bin.137]
MQPDLSIVIPVLYEGANVLPLIEHLRAIAGDVTYEVIVVDGDPEGSTLHYLPSHIQGITAPAGRGSQMNAGAHLAQAPTLLFLHADTKLPQTALAQIHITMGQTAAGAFDLGIDSPKASLQWISRVASWRSRLTRIPYGDQAIFVDRTTFHQVGGFPNIPIMEDVALMQQLKRQRIPIRIMRDLVLVSPRRWEQEGVLRCTLRNWLLLGLYTFGVSPHRLWHWYRPPSLPKSGLKN